MRKKELSDWMPFSTSLTESGNGRFKELPGGRVQVTGKFQHAGVVNRNHRVYPHECFESQLKPESDLMKAIRERRVLGQLEHPDDGRSDLRKAAVAVVDLKLREDGELIGTIETLSTADGKIAEALFRDGITVGISSRGRGSVVTRDDGVDVVQSDYQLETFDLVADPSTPGAMLVKEARDKDDSDLQPLTESQRAKEADLVALSERVLAVEGMADAVSDNPVFSYVMTVTGTMRERMAVANVFSAAGVDFRILERELDSDMSGTVSYEVKARSLDDLRDSAARGSKILRNTNAEPNHRLVAVEAALRGNYDNDPTAISKDFRIDLRAGDEDAWGMAESVALNLSSELAKAGDAELTKRLESSIARISGAKESYAEAAKLATEGFDIVPFKVVQVIVDFETVREAKEALKAQRQIMRASKLISQVTPGDDSLTLSIVVDTNNPGKAKSEVEGALNRVGITSESVKCDEQAKVSSSDKARTTIQVEFDSTEEAVAFERALRDAGDDVDKSEFLSTRVVSVEFGDNMTDKRARRAVEKVLSGLKESGSAGKFKVISRGKKPSHADDMFESGEQHVFTVRMHGDRQANRFHQALKTHSTLANFAPNPVGKSAKVFYHGSTDKAEARKDIDGILTLCKLEADGVFEGNDPSEKVGLKDNAPVREQAEDDQVEQPDAKGKTHTRSTVPEPKGGDQAAEKPKASEPQRQPKEQGSSLGKTEVRVGTDRATGLPAMLVTCEDQNIAEAHRALLKNAAAVSEMANFRVFKSVERVSPTQFKVVMDESLRGVAMDSRLGSHSSVEAVASLIGGATLGEAALALDMAGPVAASALLTSGKLLKEGFAETVMTVHVSVDLDEIPLDKREALDVFRDGDDLTSVASLLNVSMMDSGFDFDEAFVSWAPESGALEIEVDMAPDGDAEKAVGAIRAALGVDEITIGESLTRTDGTPVEAAAKVSRNYGTVEFRTAEGKGTAGPKLAVALMLRDAIHIGLDRVVAEATPKGGLAYVFSPLASRSDRSAVVESVKARLADVGIDCAFSRAVAKCPVTPCGVREVDDNVPDNSPDLQADSGVDADLHSLAMQAGLDVPTPDSDEDDGGSAFDDSGDTYNDDDGPRSDESSNKPKSIRREGLVRGLLRRVREGLDASTAGRLLKALSDSRMPSDDGTPFSKIKPGSRVTMRTGENTQITGDAAMYNPHQRVWIVRTKQGAMPATRVDVLKVAEGREDETDRSSLPAEGPFSGLGPFRRKEFKPSGKSALDVDNAHKRALLKGDEAVTAVSERETFIVRHDGDSAPFDAKAQKVFGKNNDGVKVQADSPVAARNKVGKANNLDARHMLAVRQTDVAGEGREGRQRGKKYESPAGQLTQGSPSVHSSTSDSRTGKERRMARTNNTTFPLTRGVTGKLKFDDESEARRFVEAFPRMLGNAATMLRNEGPNVDVMVSGEVSQRRVAIEAARVFENEFPDLDVDEFIDAMELMMLNLEQEGDGEDGDGDDDDGEDGEGDGGEDEGFDLGIEFESRGKRKAEQDGDADKDKDKEKDKNKDEADAGVNARDGVTFTAPSPDPAQVAAAGAPGDPDGSSGKMFSISDLDKVTDEQEDDGEDGGSDGEDDDDGADESISEATRAQMEELKSRVKAKEEQIRQLKRENRDLRDMNDAMAEIQLEREIERRINELISENPTLSRAEGQLKRCTSIDELEETAAELMDLLQSGSDVTVDQEATRTAGARREESKGGTAARTITPTKPSSEGVPSQTDLTEGAEGPTSTAGNASKTDKAGGTMTSRMAAHRKLHRKAGAR